MAAFVLALCLGFSALAFAACNGNGNYDVEIDWDVDLNQKITLNQLFPYTGLSAFGKDRTARLIEQATGYKSAYSEMASSNEDNELNGALTQKKPFHTMKITQAQFDPYVEMNAWLDLTKLLTETEEGRILYAIIDLLPGAWDSVTYTDANGKKGIYAIPECGYVPMEDYALVWNNEHLKTIGWYDDHEENPETLSEVTEALQSLQKYYGAKDTNYHALGIGGSNSSNVENIMSAFGCPNQFFVDTDGKVKKDIYSDTIVKYTEYMSMLRQDGVISDSWQGSTTSDICAKFARESNSCVFVTYWWVTPLVNTILAQKLAEKYGMSNDYDTIHDELITWRTRVRGDGSYGSEVQEKAKWISGATGNAYYIVIPHYMAKDARYAIDFLSKKLQSYALIYGGEEGIDWKVVDAPADNQEDYKNNIIYMQPWEYTLNGEKKTGGGKWIQLTSSYIANIVDNSMYMSGANVVEARSLFHLRETGFDAWPIAVKDDETIISDPTALHPVFRWWSRISILSRTMAKRGIASAMDSDDPAAEIKITRNSLKEKFAKINGIRYYYWSDDIMNEMTEWYNSKEF